MPETQGPPNANQSLPFQRQIQFRGNGLPRRPPDRAMDIEVKTFDGMNGQLNVEQAQVEALGMDQVWYSVMGCLDSGATVTVGSIQEHGKYCFLTNPMRKKRDVSLPNGSRVPVTHQGLINVRVKHSDGRLNYFQRIKIALVDDASWKWLLIGWGELAQAQATPEHALYSASLPPGHPMPPHNPNDSSVTNTNVSYNS